ncbi:MAG: peptide ABC transporter substrate-binding protein [Anaerolineae bacterium]
MLTGRMLRVLVLTAICALLATSLGGCGAATEPAEVAQPEATTAPEPTTEPEPTEEPVAEETSVVILSMEDPPSFNHFLTDTGYENLVAEMVLLGMADIGPNSEIFPELAAELPTVENGGVVIDEDAWTMDVTWTMRDDIFWEDGEPVTADDVIFTWDALTDEETGMWVPGMDYTDSIEKIDDYSFVVRYNSVYPDYLEQLGGFYGVIWPEHYCTGEGGIGTWDCNREPLANGPYLLEEWEAGDHLTFVRNPNYHEEGKPKIDKVFVQIVPEETVRQEMMLGGDGDIDFWIIETVRDAYIESDNVEISDAEFGRWLVHMWPNLAAKGSIDAEADPHPIFSDLRVRQAMRMGVNADEILEGVWGDSGMMTVQWTEFYREPYKCDVPKPEYDPEGAKALLEEAGWTDTDGDGIRECHGCTTGAPEGYEMVTEFLVYSEWGETLELAHQLLAEDLNELGMGTELGMVEGSQLWGTFDDGGIEQNGNFDLDLWDDGYAGNQLTDFLWLYYHTDAQEPDWGWNVSRWSNEEFDALLDETYTVDEEYRKEIFCQLAEILDAEVPNIPLFVSIESAGYNPRIKGVVDNANDMITWNIADWEIVEP